MKRRTEAQWCELFAEHKSSGLTAAAFCRERGLCSSHFSTRRKQLLAKEADVSTNSTPSFIPVAVSARATTSMIELHWGNAYQLCVPTSVSPDWLAAFIHQLAA